MICDKVKDTDNIVYSTKNQVRGLCVGGDLVILFFSYPAVFTHTKNGLVCYTHTQNLIVFTKIKKWNFWIQFFPNFQNEVKKT